MSLANLLSLPLTITSNSLLLSLTLDSPPPSLSPVFLNSTGTIMQKTLVAGEKIVVDTDCVLAWASGVEMELQTAGGCCGICAGGEGFYNTVFKGPGLVMVSSMNVHKYQVAVAPEPSS